MKRISWFKRHPVLSRLAVTAMLWGGLLIVLGLEPWIAEQRYLFAVLVMSAVLVGGWFFSKALVDSIAPKE